MSKQVKMRVEIPKNPKELLILAEKVYKKHLADGKDSVLSTIQDHSWDKEGVKVSNALKLHDQAEELKRQMDQAYKERDAQLAGIKEALLASRDVLSGVCRSNMKRMGEWGFVVRDTPKSTKSTPE